MHKQNKIKCRMFLEFFSKHHFSFFFRDTVGYYLIWVVTFKMFRMIIWPQDNVTVVTYNWSIATWHILFVGVSALLILNTSIYSQLETVLELPFLLSRKPMVQLDRPQKLQIVAPVTSLFRICWPICRRISFFDLFRTNFTRSVNFRHFFFFI